MTRMRILARVLRIRKIAQFLERQFSPLKYPSLPNFQIRLQIKISTTTVSSYICIQQLYCPTSNLLGVSAAASVFQFTPRLRTAPTWFVVFIFRYLFLVFVFILKSILCYLTSAIFVSPYLIDKLYS